MVDEPFSNENILHFVAFLIENINEESKSDFTLTEENFLRWNSASFFRKGNSIYKRGSVQEITSFHEIYKVNELSCDDTESLLYLDYLEKEGILEYENINSEVYTEPYTYSDLERVKGTIDIDKWNNYIESKFDELENEIQKVVDEKNIILGFNPLEMTSKIIIAKKQVEKFQRDSKDKPFLKGMEEELKEFSAYLDSIEIINDNYTEVFKNVIKPIKTESDKSIKTTRNTAIISIIASAIVSIIIQNFHSVSTFFANIVN